MPLRRRALTLLAATAALMLATAASAATSRLTPNPPAGFSPPVTTPDSGPGSPGGTPGGTTGGTTSATTTTASGTPAGTAIPRTGEDLPEELLIAGLMIAGGAALRVCRPSGRG